MPLNPSDPAGWQVRHIGVIGPGIVGMPMAALLADARIRIGQSEPAVVTVVQRASPTSGWKVDAINRGRSPIGGIEPGLDAVVARAAGAGLLRATHDTGALADADVVLVAVQTDKAGIAPDYGPLFEALHALAPALAGRPRGNVPLVVFESTLAPSSMATVVRDLFRDYGLEDGRDLLLGNSPNRVMPGRLVERVAASDKLAGGLSPVTPGLIATLYGAIVTRGTVHPTSSLAAEVVKTLENAYRDVRIAFAAEVARWCDREDIDFYQVRQQVNERLARSDAAGSDPNAVPTGGLLVPTIGVGGHCLPKDGVLLWWRLLEAGQDTGASLILEARAVNDASPADALALAERTLGPVAGRRVALLGTAYRFNSEDTRNSPTLPLARQVLDRGGDAVLHDPYVYPTDQNLARAGLAGRFTRDLDQALCDADLVVLCTAHRAYLEARDAIVGAARGGLFDGCNLYQRAAVTAPYAGIGRGTGAPPAGFADHVLQCFRAVERGVANELDGVLSYLNARYAATPFERASLADVRRLAATCTTGCDIAEPGPVARPEPWPGFASRLVDRAVTR